MSDTTDPEMPELIPIEVEPSWSPASTPPLEVIDFAPPPEVIDFAPPPEVVPDEAIDFVPPPEVQHLRWCRWLCRRFCAIW